MRWFSRGDLDGFFGLALDNLVQLLLIKFLWEGLLQGDYHPEPHENLLYTRVLPGVAVSLLIGNLFYAWQARRLAQRTNRDDVCALPYGINTVSVFAHVLLVMLPARIAALTMGASPKEALEVAWQAGLVACFGSGLIEFLGAFGAEYIRKMTPRAALLSTLAGIAVTFISIGFLFQTYARPIVGLATLGIILTTYFGRVRFRGGLPGGFVALGVGTALAWMTGIAGQGKAPLEIAFVPPTPVFGDLEKAFSSGHFLTYLSVIIPMGLFNLVGSLQNIESAEAAGDAYSTPPSLAANGIGTLAACAFGSCFPTTIYIGHPGWKAMGARAGYSVLNGLFFTIVCLTGTLALISWAVPVEAGMAIVLWIGIVITAQAFQATPREHAPAVVVGLLPAIAAWGSMQTKSGIRAASGLLHGAPDALFTPELLKNFLPIEYPDGGFRLEEGFIFTSLILAAMTVAVIERHFIRAALWCLGAAGLSLVGLMHSYQWIPGNTTMALPFQSSWPYLDVDRVAWPWVQGYALMAVAFILARWLTVEDKAAH